MWWVYLHYRGDHALTLTGHAKRGEAQARRDAIFASVYSSGQPAKFGMTPNRAGREAVEAELRKKFPGVEIVKG